MDTPSPRPAPARTRRTGRIVAAVALFLLLLVVVGRWLSPNLTLGSTVQDRTCERGVCVEHVARADWLFLAPFDEWQVTKEDNPSRYYAATNPFDPDADITYSLAGDISLTDGTVTLTWPAATIARLSD